MAQLVAQLVADPVPDVKLLSLIEQLVAQLVALLVAQLVADPVPDVKLLSLIE